MASRIVSAALGSASYREPLPNAARLADALAYVAGFDHDDYGPQAMGYIRHW